MVRQDRDVCAYGHVDFDPEKREDLRSICKQTILPRVLDWVFAAPRAPRRSDDRFY